MIFTSCNVPQIDSISPLTLAYNTILTINGTGFSLTQCENIVYIGQVECTLLTSSSNQLTCQLGMNSGLLPNIMYTLEVLVKNIGYAIHQNGFYQVSFESVVNSVTPEQGSIYGGTLVTIQGDGFSMENSFVILDLSLYSNAQLIMIEYGMIQFLTNLDQSGTFPILVNTNGAYAQCVSGCNFTFTSSSTPTLTSISPTSLTQLNTTFTLAGTNFGSNLTDIQVFVGQQMCQVVSIQSGSLTCSLPYLELGSQYVTVLVDGLFF